MKKIILSISLIAFSWMTVSAQGSKPGHFIGTYDKDEGGKTGVCSDRGLERQEVADSKEYQILTNDFRQKYKTQSPTTYLISGDEAFIVYEYETRVGGWNCTIKTIRVKTGKTIENCKQKLADDLAKSPKDFTTQPVIIFEWAGKGDQTITNNSDKEQTGKDGATGSNNDNSPGSGTSGNAENSNKSLPCPTYSFKFSNNNPSYNCVALEWWALSAKTNMADASGNFKQAKGPQAKSFTIEFRKQGEINWTIENRMNTGKNTHSISGLDACTKYEVRMITRCDNGQVSAPTNIIRFTTVCTKPGKLTIGNITSNSAKVSSQRLSALVTFPCSGAASTQIRIIEFKTGTTAWQEITCNSGSPCVLYALVANTKYKVRARYKYGYNLYSEYTNEVSFTTAIN